MARDFNGTSDYAINNAAVVTAFPLTMVCWFNSDTITAGQAAMSLGLAGGTQRLQLTVNGASIGDPIHAASITSGGAVVQAASASGYSANTWHHAAAIFGSTTSRYAALDGVLGSEDTASSDPGIASLNRTLLGARIASGSVGGYTNGRIAEAAIYNVALTAAEIAMLAKGYSPLMVRPDALVAYWPVVGRNSPETDIVGAFDLTLTGTSASEHPRIIRPSAQILQFPSAAAGSLNVSATTDALTLAEYAATIGKSLNISATTDALTLAEYAATVGSAIDISATTDALTLAEYPATIGLSLNVQATTDALTLAEYPASLGNTQNVQATTDALTLAEYPATLSFALNVSATTDALTLAEYAATISDASAVGAAVATGGIGHGKKRRRKRVVVEGYVYLVDEDKERALLARLAQEKAQEAQLLEALGDPQTAAEVRRKAFRIARRADMADPYERIRKDDEEVISRFIGLLAA